MAILGKIFDANRREVKSLSKLADKVLAKDEEYSNLSDEELVNKTEEFKAYIQEHDFKLILTTFFIKLIKLNEFIYFLILIIQKF